MLLIITPFSIARAMPKAAIEWEAVIHKILAKAAAPIQGTPLQVFMPPWQPPRCHSGRTPLGPTLFEPRDLEYLRFLRFEVALHMQMN
jgi:hypothetical protein